MRTSVAIALLGGACLSRPSPFSSDAGGDASSRHFTGRTWTRHSDANFRAPGPMFAPKLVYDESMQRVLLYGGETELVAPYWGETLFELDETGWLPLCGSSGPLCMPGSRSDFGFTYDPAGQRTLLFGGQTYDNQTGLIDVLADTWQLAGGQWSQVSITMPALEDVHMVYDTAAHQTLVVAGYDSPTPAVPAVYAFGESGNPVITLLSASQQVADRGATGVYDPVRDRVLAFPGEDPQNGFYGTLAAYAPSSGTWSTLCATCTAGSSFRTPAMVFDPLYGNLVMIGGFDSDSNHLQGVLGLDDATSRLDFLANLGAPRSGMGVAYDKQTDTIVLYGGATDAVAVDPDCAILDVDHDYCATTWLGTPNYSSD